MSGRLAHRCTSEAQGAASDRGGSYAHRCSGPDLQFPARALDFDSLPQSARVDGSLFAAAERGFLDGLFDRRDIRQLLKEFSDKLPATFEHLLKINGIGMGNLMVEFGEALFYLCFEVLLLLGGKVQLNHGFILCS